MPSALPTRLLPFARRVRPRERTVGSRRPSWAAMQSGLSEVGARWRPRRRGWPQEDPEPGSKHDSDDAESASEPVTPTSLGSWLRCLSWSRSRGGSAEAMAVAARLCSMLRHGGGRGKSRVAASLAELDEQPCQVGGDEIPASDEAEQKQDRQQEGWESHPLTSACRLLSGHDPRHDQQDHPTGQRRATRRSRLPARECRGSQPR